MDKLVIATRNIGKVTEITGYLSLPGLQVIGLDAFPPFDEIDETGRTFEENASIKAIAAFEKINIPVLADDSGLEVDALNGAPGIYSARYSGENATDESNNLKLLKHLEMIPKEKRTARFVCVMVLYEGKVCVSFRGECLGKIIFEPRGNGGFGYDPLFVPSGFDKTYAELPLSIKNSISHRGKALSKVKEYLVTRTLSGHALLG